MIPSSQLSPKTMVLPVAAIFIGVLILLGNMNVIPAELANLWPVVLVFAGLLGISMSDKTQKVSHSSAHPAPAKKAKPASKKRKGK